MRLLVISDSHGDLSNAVKAIKNTDNVDLLVHLGDYYRDALKLQEMFPGLAAEYVYGNSDFLTGDTMAEKTLEYEGVKIFITNGHRYSIKWGYERLCMKANDVNADMVLFGHTHKADAILRNGRLLLNPGSISESRSSRNESYAVIDINKGLFNYKLCYI